MGELEEEISKKIAENQFLGLMISIVTSTKTIYSQGFGYTSQLKNQEVNQDTLVGLQSTTKTFTALAFLRAVELGYVKLDDKIISYYPEFIIKDRYTSDLYKEITFRMLLSHNAGLPSTTIKGGCFNEDICSFDERVKTIKEIFLLNRPHTSKHYSNIGFDLVAYAIQMITGLKYFDFLFKELLNPLGITSMTLQSSEAVKNPNCFYGYLGSIESSFRQNDNGYGCGTGFISHRDLIKIQQFILRRGKTESGINLLSSHLFDEFFSGEIGDYGLGVFIDDFNGATMYYHPGGGFGFISFMNWIPEFDVGVLIHSNQEYQDYCFTLPEKILNSYIANHFKVEVKSLFPDLIEKDDIFLDNSILKDLEGVYSGIDGYLKIVFKENKLFMKLFGTNYEMTCKGGNMTEEFIFISEKSKYTKFTISQQKKMVEFFFNDWHKLNVYYYTGISMNKTPDKAKPKWQMYQGLYSAHYYISEINIILIRIKNGLLLIDDEPLFHYKDNIFNKLTGDFVEFHDFYVRIDNGKADKLDNPVEYFTSLYNDNPKHPQLRYWVLNKAISSLKELQREKEALEIEKLKKKISEKHS